MMSRSMLISGKPEESPRFGNVEIGPGLDFISGTIIDTHFSQRGRCGRLMTAVAHYPQDVGIGIDEDTAILVTNEAEFKVIGSGSVIIVDGSPMTHTNLNDLKHGERLELHDLALHVLPRGRTLRLAQATPYRRSSQAPGRRVVNSKDLIGTSHRICVWIRTTAE